MSGELPTSLGKSGRALTSLHRGYGYRW